VRDADAVDLLGEDVVDPLLEVGVRIREARGEAAPAGSLQSGRWDAFDLVLGLAASWSLSVLRFLVDC
jgi:hypothetical protein